MPALAAVGAFFRGSVGTCKAAESFTGELLFSDLISTVTGSSFTGSAGVEFGDDDLDGGGFGVGLSCGHRDK